MDYDKVDVNGRIKQAKGQFQAMREIMTFSVRQHRYENDGQKILEVIAT